MIQRGIVIGKSLSKARVKVGRCVGCKGEKHCPFSLDISEGKAHEIELEADDPIGVSIGNYVQVETETGPIVKGILILYTLPLFLFLGGMATANRMASAIGLTQLLAQLIGGACGLFIWYLVIRRFNNSFQENYRIVEVERLTYGDA